MWARTVDAVVDVLTDYSLTDYSQVVIVGSWYKFVNFGVGMHTVDAVIDVFTDDSLTDYSQVVIVGSWYKSVNFGGGMHTVDAVIDVAEELGGVWVLVDRFQDLRRGEQALERLGCFV